MKLKKDNIAFISYVGNYVIDREGNIYDNYIDYSKPKKIKDELKGVMIYED